MTPRENLLKMYRREGYRHAPVTLSLCPALVAHYRRIARETPLHEYFDYPEGFAALDLRPLPVKDGAATDWTRFHPEGVKEGTVFDAFGIGYEPGGDAGDHFTRMRHPMERFDSLEQMQSYPWPEFETDDIGDTEQRARDIHADGRAAIGSMQMTIWETAWYIRSMEALMLDMLAEDEKAVFLLDKITAYSAQRAAAYARAGADLLSLGDDVGTQRALMMSETMYRTWLKPRLAEVIAAAKREKPDILVFYHTDGFVTPIIDDLIETGVEILNPVQPECMDFAEIHAAFGDRLSFCGTLGTQTTMPFGSPDDVRGVVRRNLEIARAKGGLLCCPTHMLEPEVPWENVEAYVNACKAFRP